MERFVSLLTMPFPHAAQNQQAAPKKKWKFMQKYWHKGAYYQTGADDQFQQASKSVFHDSS